MTFWKRIKLSLHIHEDGAVVGGISNTQPANDSPAQDVQVIYGLVDGDTTPDAGQEPGNTSTDATADTAKRQTDYATWKETYKDLYGNDVKQAIDRRLKGSTRELAEHREIVDQLTTYFGDMDALKAFLKNDVLPDIEGTETYKALLAKRGSPDNGAEDDTASADVQPDPAVLVAQGVELLDKLKPMGMEFSLPAELEKPEFSALVNKGLTVEQAYYALNHDSIVMKASQKAAEAMKQATIESIRSKGVGAIQEQAARPSPAVVHKADPSALSKQDLADIRKRVMAGESIRW